MLGSNRALEPSFSSEYPLFLFYCLHFLSKNYSAPKDKDWRRLISFCKNDVAYNLYIYWLYMYMCAWMCVVVLCANVLDVQTWRHRPDQIIHCFQREVVSTQPARHTYTHVTLMHRISEILVTQLLRNKISWAEWTHISETSLGSLVQTSAMCLIPVSFRLLSLKLQRQNKGVTFSRCQQCHLVRTTRKITF